MKKAERLAIMLMVVVALLLVTACKAEPTTQTGSGGAEQISDVGFNVPKNSQGHTAEQQNIIDRLKVTTDPTKVLWIHLISLDGDIIRRMPVSHKVTSSGKRLEPIQAASSNEYGANYPYYIAPNGGTYETNEFMQPDGTFGSSDAYIFWFDPMHRYHQWGTAGGLGYLLTDYPIDLTDPQDLITGMYNTDLAAYQWQKSQEAQMCAGEGKTYSSEGGCK